MLFVEVALELRTYDPGEGRLRVWLVRIAVKLLRLFCNVSWSSSSSLAILTNRLLVKLWRGQKESVPAAFGNSAQNNPDCCSDRRTNRLIPPGPTAKHLQAVFSGWRNRVSLRRLSADEGAPLYATGNHETTSDDETSGSESRSERVYLPRGDRRRPAGGIFFLADRRVQPRFALSAVWIGKYATQFRIS